VLWIPIWIGTASFSRIRPIRIGINSKQMEKLINWTFYQKKIQYAVLNILKIMTYLTWMGNIVNCSVPDPHVSGPPGSESISQRYGSGSFNHQAKKGTKTLIPTVLWLHLNFLSLKNDVKVPSKSNEQKNFKKYCFYWRLEGQWRKWQYPHPHIFQHVLNFW
jgi:hypothetical protein